MLPKSSKNYIQPTADKLDCSAELVEDAVGFFYSIIRKNITEMTGDNIQIPHLGSFRVKSKELPKLVAKYQQHLNVLQPETFNQMKLQKSIQIKLDRVLNLQKQIHKERVRKIEFIELKNENKAKSNME